jgi:hypothetical protein
VLNVERAVEIDSDDAVPEIDVGIEKRLCLVPARDIREEVDRPCFALELPCGVFDLTVIDNVDLVDRYGAASRGAHRFRSRRTCFVQVKDADGAAFISETDCGGTPDATGPARHHTTLSAQSAHARSQGSSHP